MTATAAILSVGPKWHIVIQLYFVSTKYCVLLPLIFSDISCFHCPVVIVTTITLTNLLITPMHSHICICCSLLCHSQTLDSHTLPVQHVWVSVWDWVPQGRRGRGGEERNRFSKRMPNNTLENGSQPEDQCLTWHRTIKVPSYTSLTCVHSVQFRS
jgi:hypothetical protein